MEESIYNLISVPPEEIVKPPIYRSKHDPTMAPSYSTIGLQNTSKLITNTGGDTTGTDKGRKPHATMGSVATKPTPMKFLKKAAEVVPNLTGFERGNTQEKKAPVPTREERPIMGLRSDKNFVVANSVENIISVPKKKHVAPVAATARADYGKAPKYLQKIKEAIAQDQDYIAQSMELAGKHEMPHFMREIDPTEKEEMVKALREKFEEKQKVYYALPLSKDTASQCSKKEQLEKEMIAIEAALKKIEKEVILVYSDQNKLYSLHAREAALKEAQKLAAERSVKPKS